MTPPTRSVACIGAINLDRKAMLSQRLRMGTSNPVSVTLSPGGVARNCAEAVARLGLQVSICGIVGDDSAGAHLLAGAEALGIDVSGVIRSTRHPTAGYTAVLSPAGALEVGLADTDIYDELDPDWAERIGQAMRDAPIWIVDANLPAPSLERLIRDYGGHAMVLADPVSTAKAERLRPVLAAVDFLFPDRAEAAQLAGCPVETVDDAREAARTIQRLGAGTVAVSLGEMGVVVAHADGAPHYPAMAPRPLVDVTGAGDAFIAGYAFALAIGDAAKAYRYGLAAACLTAESASSVAPDLTRVVLEERLAEEQTR
ncbi:MAG: carbohydrate kinase family protein [Alphaproteobacteria bacterium]